MPDLYREPLEFIQPIISEVEKLSSDREKVIRLNEYLKSLLTYEKGATAMALQAFAPHDGERPAACGSYGRDFKFLCQAAGIPCITVSSTTHTWNMVYADGRWLYVDVSTNDFCGWDMMLKCAMEINQKVDVAQKHDYTVG